MEKLKKTGLSNRFCPFQTDACLLGLSALCIVVSLFLVLINLEDQGLHVPATSLSVTGSLGQQKPPTSRLSNSIVGGRLLIPNRNFTVLLPKFVLGGVVSQSQFSVSIQAKNIAGRLQNGCVDFFLVNISGSALYSPVVACKDGGVYTFLVDLVEPGIYNLKIRLGGSVGPLISADHCYSEGHNMSFDDVGEQESINFIFRPEQLPGSPAPKALSDSAALEMCSPEEFYHGRFVSDVRNYSIGGALKFNWKPFQTRANCDWPAFWGRKRSFECLEGKWIAFIGDSTLREIALDFAVDLYGSFDPSWAHPSVRNRWNYDRLWDTGHSRPGLPRVSFIFIGHWVLSKNCGGVVSLWRRAVQTRLEHTFGNLSSPTPADTLIFNSGLHDICDLSNETSGASLVNKFDRALGFVSKLGKQLVWKTTSPRLQHCVMHFGYTARARWLDEHVIPMARRHGFQIADQYHLNMVSQVGGDGMHCNKGLSCLVFASSLMNFICPVRESNALEFVPTAPTATNEQRRTIGAKAKSRTKMKH
uniref:Uncharacterized protein n=1 Tax=Cyanoptyche gloeocystis TaxID=77922 RepID=A0A7S2NQ17_9EUKA|mmetsp:Transcript_278/g.575  ORF Transcript_278/g.575 Transcript_278/m.575 type:complete len:531 (+) Transcript_278:44-1636(+)